MNAMGMSQLTKATFKAAMTPMPHEFEKPPDSQQYGQAFSALEKVSVPNPMALFRPESLNLYHTTAATVIGSLHEKFIDGILAAFGQAVDNWAKVAVLVNVKVNAVTAAAGKIQGPPMEGLIMASQPPMQTPQLQKYSKAVAKAVGAAWDKWAKDCKVPGLPWYPAFAAFPGPTAPPMPNIPVPLILLQSSSEAEMSQKKLQDAMVKALGDKKAAHHELLFKSLATGISTMFLAWKASTMVTNVMGTGPIPTFAPPFVPVGPVVNGTGTQMPAGLVSPPSGAAGLKKGGPDEVEKLKKQAKQMEEKAKNAEKEAKNAMKKLEADFDQATKELNG